MITSRTPTETLAEAKKQFKKDDPKDCLVIWFDSSNQLNWKSTTEQIPTNLGLVEAVRTIMKKWLEEETGSYTDAKDGR